MEVEMDRHPAVQGIPVALAGEVVLEAIHRVVRRLKVQALRVVLVMLGFRVETF